MLIDEMFNKKQGGLLPPLILFPTFPTVAVAPMLNLKALCWAAQSTKQWRELELIDIDNDEKTDFCYTYLTVG